MTVLFSKDTSLEETIQPKSLELFINEKSYDIGDGCGEVIKFEDDFNVKVDGFPFQARISSVS